MMILLFSACKAWMLGSEALVFLFCMTRLYDGASILSVLLLLLLGSVLCFFAVSLYATTQHHRLLLVLYSLQRPDDFIRLYEPLLSRKFLPANLRFTLTAYLSNGYAAKGDFVKARALLKEAPLLGKRQQKNRALILCENAGSIALSEGSVQLAQEQLAQLPELIKALPAKKRAQHEAILKTMTAQLHVIKQEATMEDCDLLREESKKAVSALRKTELCYAVGMAYAQLGEYRFAREYLAQAADAKVYYGKLAARALKDLPARA